MTVQGGVSAMVMRETSLPVALKKMTLQLTDAVVGPVILKGSENEKGLPAFTVTVGPFTLRRSLGEALIRVTVPLLAIAGRWASPAGRCNAERLTGTGAIPSSWKAPWPTARSALPSQPHSVLTRQPISISVAFAGTMPVKDWLVTTACLDA